MICRTFHPTPSQIISDTIFSFLPDFFSKHLSKFPLRTGKLRTRYTKKGVPKIRKICRSASDSDEALLVSVKIKQRQLLWPKARGLSKRNSCQSKSTEGKELLAGMTIAPGKMHLTTILDWLMLLSNISNLNVRKISVPCTHLLFSCHSHTFYSSTKYLLFQVSISFFILYRFVSVSEGKLLSATALNFVALCVCHILSADKIVNFMCSLNTIDTTKSNNKCVESKHSLDQSQGNSNKSIKNP